MKKRPPKQVWLMWTDGCFVGFDINEKAARKEAAAWGPNAQVFGPYVLATLPISGDKQT